MLDKDFNRPAKHCKITSFEIVILFALDMCSKPIFCLKRLLRKAKLARSCLNREMLLQTPKDTSKLPSTIMQDRPNIDSLSEFSE